MRFSEIQPFIRYVHYLPLTPDSQYNSVIPYDNRCFFTYRGKAAMLVRDTLYELKEGDLLLIPSGTPYQILPPKHAVTYLAVNFDYTEANLAKAAPIPPIDHKRYNPDMKLESVNFTDMALFNQPFYLPKQSALAGKFLKMEQEYSKKLIGYEKMIAGIFNQILISCVRATYEQKFTESSETVHKIIGFLHENYEKPLTNKMIADAVHLHPNYVSSLIKIFTGMPLHRYLMQIRISHSVELLKETDASIGEIAEKCGFSGIYHYSKAFRQIMGVPPSKY